MSIETVVDIATTIGFFFGFIWLGFVFYLKSKWLPFVEDTLDGHRFYSLNIFFAGQGILHYDTVFISKFHAKRYGMLEKRGEVPKSIQRVFIFSLIFFLVTVLLFFGSPGILYLLSDM